MATTMKVSDKTARELYEELKTSNRPRIGFGRKPCILNVDLQNAYTSVAEFVTAYESHPRQIEFVNTLSQVAREKQLPVVWTYVAYLPSAEDCGVWGTRSDTPDSLQNIKIDSRRAALDDRVKVAPSDNVINKRMASAFFETRLASLLVWHRIDTVIVTGGSTSGCVRATVIDSLSHGYRTVVPEECVADKHESPHFANLYDMSLKYADVIPVSEVLEYLHRYTPSNG